jgi:hypothetical protein
MPDRSRKRPSADDRCGSILLQNDFGPRSEEHFFQIKPEKGILIQESDRSDSNIAHFW